MSLSCFVSGHLVSLVELEAALNPRTEAGGFNERAVYDDVVLAGLYDGLGGRGFPGFWKLFRAQPERSCMAKNTQ